MTRIVLAATLCVFLTGNADADDNRDKASCAVVKQQIREIESKMRTGYTRAQGEKYEAKLRELRAKRYKLCR